MNYLLLCIAATCIVANTNAFDLPDIDCNDERGSGIDQTMIARNIKRTLFGSISDENSAHDKEYKAHRANELIKIYCYSKYFTNVVAAAGQFIETQNPTKRNSMSLGKDMRRKTIEIRLMESSSTPVDDEHVPENIIWNMHTIPNI